MPTRAVRIVVVLMLAWVAIAALAQTPAEPVSDDPVADLLQETQSSIRGKEYAGMVWWIPVEFWERAMLAEGVTADKAAEQVKPLREFIMVAVVVGKVGAFGSISFASADQVRAKTVLRDARGANYSPVTKVAPEAENLASLMKPILANAVGKMGESMEVLFFPARNGSGQWLADPRQKGSFSIVLKELAGKPETVMEWQLPLTALSPPKYCPVGKERVHANWNFCPWHGVALNEAAAKPEAKPGPPK